jgi:uncharacterized OsmC-like protein
MLTGVPKIERAMTPAELRELYRRKAAAMTRRPAFARGSGAARVRLREGMACDVEVEDRTLRADLSASEGGTGTGPHPGQLMRASLAACMAIGYRLWGARLDVAIDAVEVEVGCDYDARGQMGLGADVAIGWERLRFVVTIASPASEADVRRVVETADCRSPMLANISPAVRRSYHLTVLPSPPSAETHAQAGGEAVTRG